MKALVILHRHYIKGFPKKGGFDYILEELINNNYELDVIEHPIEIYNSKSKFKKIKLKPPFIFIFEFFKNIFLVIKRNKKYDLIISSDPLNFLPTYFFKKFNYCKKLYFHSVDYSPSRFDNLIFEFLYQRLYKFAIKNADLTSVVSKRVHDKFKFIAKNMIIRRNIPIIPNIKFRAIDKRNKDILLISEKFTDHLETENILSLVKKLVKTYKTIKLIIIGLPDTEFKENVKKLNLEKNIIYKGFLSREEVFKEISKNYIGLSWYSNKDSHIHFGDSLKIREYLACGLPVVCDNLTSTSEEVKSNHLGYVCTDVDDFYNKMIRLIKDKKEYKVCINNIIKYNGKNLNENINAVLERS